MKCNFLKLVIVCISVTSLLFSCKEEAKEEYKEIKYFTINEEGELERPKDYRTWIFVGTPVTPNELNGGKAPFPEMHNVYIDPVSFEHYKKTGKFREGTILMKELVSVGSTAAVSGKGYFMGEFIGLEASVKSKEHFPDEPGNWAIFSFTSPKDGILKDTSPKFPVASCVACHDASAEDDFVFTQYYPVLRAAKGVGEDIIPENAARRFSEEGMEMSGMTDIWEPTAETPDNKSLDIPLDKDELFKFLKEGKYKSFSTQEKNLHPSLGPHQKLGLPVRVFMNDILAKSLDADNEEHPLGATLVKEMYDKDEVLSGWAVMVKTSEKTDGGKGWFWYEVTSTEDPTQTAAVGNGVVGCFSCHSVGRDMVRTPYPFDE